MPAQTNFTYGSDGQGSVSSELMLYQENNTNGYIAASGDFVANTSYMTYLYTAPVDVELWVTYTGTCILATFNEATVSSTALIARYSSANSNLPTESAKLLVPAGKTIGISMAKANGAAQYPTAFAMHFDVYVASQYINLDVVVFRATTNNGVALTVTGGNTVSVAAYTATNNTAGVVLGASNGAKIVNGIIQMDMTVIPVATLSTNGTVQTRNSTDPQVTSATISVVPTQYYVQTEIARLDQAIIDAQGALRYEVISSYTEP